MADDLTAALFTGHELRGNGPAWFVRESRPDIVAGYGLGDLAALVAADALDLEDGVRLAVLREQLIAFSGERAAGGMLEIADANAADAADRIAELSGAHVACLDSPGQSAVAGSHRQLGRARAAAADLHIAISDRDAPAALHCPAMATTSDVFEVMLASIEFRTPSMPVYSSVTAEPIDDPRATLARCLDEKVLWSDTVRALDAAGTGRFVEVGASGLGHLVHETLGGELVHA